MPAPIRTQAETAFRRNLKALMREREWTAADLSRASTVSQQMISALLSGKRSPTLGTVALLAHGLSVDPERLVRR